MKKRFGVGGLLVLLLAGGGAPALASDPEASMAVKLRVGADESLATIASAKGVQIYECRATQGKYGKYEWALVGPEADLFDTRGMKVGRHYTGPSWEANDGSKVVGSVLASATAPDAVAIPWLLLGAKSVGPAGTFSTVSSVRRVHTTGGIAPDSGCSAAAAGTLVRVPYTADYYFFTKE
ncbi:MAG TPA: DUF3455 domain-containing protein [Burkholderiales bacterium]|jgi:hypothetical protein|nr:DUF3455 domain-containing protein [Burkholderiales bacterium]